MRQLVLIFAILAVTIQAFPKEINPAITRRTKAESQPSTTGTLFPRGDSRGQRSSPSQESSVRQQLQQTRIRSPSPDSHGSQSQGLARSGASNNNQGNNGASSRSQRSTPKRFPASAAASYAEHPVKIHTTVKGPAEIQANSGKNLENMEEVKVRAGHKVSKTFSNPYAAEVMVEATGRSSVTQGWAKGSRRASARGGESKHNFKVGTGFDREPRPSDLKVEKNKLLTHRHSNQGLRASTRLRDHPAAINSKTRGPGFTIFRASNSEAASDESRTSSISSSSDEVGK